MAREVIAALRETVQPHVHALEKQVITLECDDGAEYVFERPTDSPRDEYRLARRVKPDGEISTSKAQLPGSVKESLDDAGIEWTK